MAVSLRQTHQANLPMPITLQSRASKASDSLLATICAAGFVCSGILTYYSWINVSLFSIASTNWPISVLGVVRNTGLVGGNLLTGLAAINTVSTLILKNISPKLAKNSIIIPRGNAVPPKRPIHYATDALQIKRSQPFGVNTPVKCQGGSFSI